VRALEKEGALVSQTAVALTFCAVDSEAVRPEQFIQNSVRNFIDDYSDYHIGDDTPRDVKALDAPPWRRLIRV
jgi:hypothetical protein